MNSRRIAFALCSLTMAASLGLVAFSQIVSGETSDGLSSWVDVQPEIKKITNLSDTQFQDAALDPQCKYQDVHEWGYNPGWGPKLDYSRQGCLVSMASGYYDTNNKSIVAFGTDRLQRLKDPLGDDLRQIVIQPAPNTNRLALVYDSYYPFSNGGAKLKLVDDWAEKFPASVTLDGYSNVERIRSTAYDYELKDSGGNYVEIRTQGLKFSANGEWLHVLLRDKSHAVLNVITHEVVSYSGPTESNWAVRNAVSNNGRYVAITQQQDSFKIYDLNQCDTTTIEFVSRNCHSIELFDRLKDFVGPNAQISIGNVEFVGVGDALDVDVRYSTDDTDWRYETVRLSIPGYVPIKYLAMGDSFSSGEGAYAYRSPTDFYIDDTTYNLCHQSKKSYPYLIQQAQNFEWFNSVACSGAMMKDVEFYDAITDYYDKRPQALSGVLNEEKAAQYKLVFSPGYVSQFEFVREYSPSIATISIGGNDIGFGDIISTCIINKNISSGLSQTCFNDRKDREMLANKIDQKISALAVQYQGIKNSMSGAGPRLYVIGYPQIIRSEGFCGLNVPLQQSEMYAATALTDYINAAIKAAADAAGIRFVNMTNALVDDTGDYRLCSDKSELAVNGLVLLGKSTKKPDQWPYYSESFHPNQLGQAMMAATIKQQTANLTQEMPTVKDGTANLHDKRVNFVGDDDVLYQNYRITYQKDIAPHLVVRGGQTTVDSSNDENDLPAQQGTDATAILHSEPVEIGHLPVSLDGKISGSVIIPAATEPGYHKIILRYVDIAGNTVERYQFVYIAASDDDWDGDGVSNVYDPCSIIRQSGIDQDRDGIDDACDDEYVKAVSVSSEPLSQANNGIGLASSNSSAPKAAALSQNSIYLPDNDSSESIFFAQTPIQLPIDNKQNEAKDNSRVTGTTNDKAHASLLSYFLVGMGVVVCGVLVVIGLRNHIRS